MSTQDVMNRVKSTVSVENLLNAEPSELVACAAKGAAIVAGAAVAFEVFKHRRLLSVIGVGAAAAVLMKQYLDQSSSTTRRRSRHALDRGPSFPGENVAEVTQAPQDDIDEASMESFPASDPPASYRRA